MTLDIDIEGWPGTSDWAALAERAVDAAEMIAPELAQPRLSASLIFTSDAEMHALNREWRGKDQPTNVLSFPMMARSELLALSRESEPAMLGDIAIAYETCSREAGEKGIAIEQHAAHLIVHGLLHLAGHDHVDPVAAAAMEALETKALASMGIADPYGND